MLALDAGRMGLEAEAACAGAMKLPSATAITTRRVENKVDLGCPREHRNTCIQRRGG